MRFYLYSSNKLELRSYTCKRPQSVWRTLQALCREAHKSIWWNDIISRTTTNVLGQSKVCSRKYLLWTGGQLKRMLNSRSKKCSSLRTVSNSRVKSLWAKKLQKVSFEFQEPKAYRPLRVGASAILGKCCTSSRTAHHSNQGKWRFSTKYWQCYWPWTAVDPCESADL